MVLLELPLHKHACPSHRYRVQEITKHKVGRTPNGIIFIPSFMKISPLVQKLHEDTCSIDTYFLSLRKESRLKKITTREFTFLSFFFTQTVFEKFIIWLHTLPLHFLLLSSQLHMKYKPDMLITRTYTAMSNTDQLVSRAVLAMDTCNTVQWLQEWTQANLYGIVAVTALDTAAAPCSSHRFYCTNRTIP